MAMITEARPETAAEAARILAQADRTGQNVRLRGAGTKLGWGRPVPAADLELCTARLNALTEHNRGDLTAVLEAGVPFETAQAAFAQADQMLALDPPLGEHSAATIGGVVATADSGPLRHRYGTPRDLVIGMTIALADGTIAKSGGKVIKNVAGYDLAKLHTGAFGTLGLIVSVSVRLHPLHRERTTAVGAARSADTLAAAALAMAAMPLEFDALDIAWRRGQGGILMRCSGSEHARRAARAAHRLSELGLTGVDMLTDDEPLWERQRAGQRSREGALVRLAAPPASLGTVVRAVDGVDGTLVGRAALGTGYVELAPDRVVALRGALPPGTVAVLLDATAAARTETDPWGGGDERAIALMRSVKTRFDPAGTCNRGLFVDGI